MSKGTFSDITPVQQMISSCTGALLTSLLVTPLDVVKIRLQTQKQPLSKGKCFLYCNGLMDHVCTCLNGNSSPKQNWYKRKIPGQLNGTIDAFIQTSRHEGVRSLWSGLPPTLVMALPATVVYFSCYEQVRGMLGYSSGITKNELWKPILAGASARTVACVVISPLEMVRTKMQSEQLKYKQVYTAIQHTVREGGKLALFRGLMPTLLRDVPFSALYWFGYESMKAYLLEVNHSKQLTSSQNFISGAISGGIASIITLPFDVIKTHRQISVGEIQLQGKKEISSTFTLINQLIQREGIHAIFAGLVPRVVKVAPACAIMISSYEYFKTYFKRRNQEARSSAVPMALLHQQTLNSDLNTSMITLDKQYSTTEHFGDDLKGNIS